MSGFAATIRDEKTAVIWSTVGLIVGSLFMYLSYFLGSTWYYAPLPPERYVQLYVTPKTQVVLGSYFTPGHPSVRISMSEFEKQSKGESFILSYSPYWESLRKPHQYQSDFSYIMKKPDADIYLYASVSAPTFWSEGYTETAVFNPIQKAFTSEFEVAYGNAVWAVIWALVGSIILLITFCAAGAIFASDLRTLWSSIRRRF